MVDFLKYWKVYLTISTVVLVFGLTSIFSWGYIYSIDFVGGTNVEYRFDKSVTDKQIRQVLGDNKIELISIDDRGKNDFYIRLPAIDEKKELDLRQALEKKLGTTIDVLRTETVGPTIGAEAMRKTAIAAGVAIIGILLYIAWAFKNVNFAIAAILAMFHDVLVVVGIFSVISYFFGAELDTLFVTALLTT
ncbi:protein translocase subunit SecF, partial [Candidatus Woesebacteria bacterium]|nr:protein translocase subunit SecF [Candidatus Woesebacteria bacterium]